jgi:hypothetical protein
MQKLFRKQLHFNVEKVVLMDFYISSIFQNKIMT